MSLDHTNIQGALEETFPGKKILVTMHYEVFVDGRCVQATNALNSKGFSGGMAMDLYHMHGIGTPTEMVDIFVKDVTAHLTELGE